MRSNAVLIDKKQELAATAPPRWYACYTRGHHERRVVAQLEQAGVEAYLPLHVRERQWSDRRKLLACPIFPSYVFARVPTASLSTLRGLHGFVAIVGSCGMPLSIPDEDIANVRRFVDAINTHHLMPQTETGAIEVGDRVRVCSGPLRGLVGTVAERRGERRIVVGLASLGRGVSLGLGIATVVRIGGKARSSSSARGKAAK